MPDRRRLTFERIDDIMPDVDRLIVGHTTVGNWNLGAICDHLSKTVFLSLDSELSGAPATREQAVYRRLFFRASAFPEGQTPPFAVQMPAEDADPAITAESLRDALARLHGHQGPFATHPMLGPLTRDEWLLFHARHASHHLSFALPI